MRDGKLRVPSQMKRDFCFVIQEDQSEVVFTSLDIQYNRISTSLMEKPAHSKAYSNTKFL